MSPNESAPAPPRSGLLTLATAVGVAVLGVATILGSLPLGYWTALGPGPGFFPLWLGVLLAVLGGAWVFTTLKDNGVVDSPSEVLAAAEEAPEYSTRTVVAIVVSLSILAAVLEVLGYQLSMFIFMLYHLLILGRRGLLLSLALAASGSFGVFVIFSHFLSVPLPTSSVPFLAGLGL